MYRGWKSARISILLIAVAVLSGCFLDSRRDDALVHKKISDALFGLQSCDVKLLEPVGWQKAIDDVRRIKKELAEKKDPATLNTGLRGRFYDGRGPTITGLKRWPDGSGRYLVLVKIKKTGGGGSSDFYEFVLAMRADGWKVIHSGFVPDDEKGPLTTGGVDSRFAPNEKYALCCGAGITDETVSLPLRQWGHDRAAIPPKIRVFGPHSRLDLREGQIVGLAWYPEGTCHLP